MGNTRVGIDDTRFTINAELTYKGRSNVEGLLFNIRTVNATFDDTLGIRPYWDDDGSRPENDFAGYGQWKSPQSAFANTDRFIAALPEYLDHGILAINLNFQGGQALMSKPWIEEGRRGRKRPNGHRDFLHNSGFHADGSFDPDYLNRITSVIEACDRLGMVVILQCFYFGQDTVFADEDAILKAVDNTVDYLYENRFTNVLLEIANEIYRNHYHHDILTVKRINELVVRARARAQERHGFSLLTSTSEAGMQKWQGDEVDAVFSESDFVILHGPGELDAQENPDAAADQPRSKVEIIRSRPWFQARPRPIIFNESHGRKAFEYAVENGVSWGLHSGDFLQTMWPPKWGVWENHIKWYFDQVRELTQ